MEQFFFQFFGLFLSISASSGIWTLDPRIASWVIYHCATPEHKISKSLVNAIWKQI